MTWDWDFAIERFPAIADLWGGCSSQSRRH
jgi:hypothetical protein